jgi:hypothetical protein
MSELMHVSVVDSEGLGGIRGILTQHTHGWVEGRVKSLFYQLNAMPSFYDASPSTACL